MTAPAPYSPRRDLLAKLQRRMVQYRVVKPIEHDFADPIVSFTFDDFPVTAAKHGAALLDQFDMRGTFYAATGLQGQTTAMGEIASASDLVALAESGHEIAAHSHAHEDMAVMPEAEALADFDRGREMLAEPLSRPLAEHFAYPFGETTVRLKNSLAPKLQSARGILAGINRRGSDLMQLRSAELTPEQWTLERARTLLQKLAEKPGWLIFFTHDVSDTPSPYGVSTRALGDLISQVRSMGIEVLHVGEVIDRKLA